MLCSSYPCPATTISLKDEKLLVFLSTIVGTAPCQADSFLFFQPSRQQALVPYLPRVWEDGLKEEKQSQEPQKPEIPQSCVCKLQ